MKVVFLCGGAGKRMFPITEDKFLLKFLGKTLLEHQIEQVLAAALGDIVIVGNQQNMGRISEVVGKFPRAGIALAIQSGPAGMADALKSAQNLLEGEILVVNPSDVFERSAYTRILEEREKGWATSYILGAKVERYFPGGYLIVNEEGEIQHIVEKPERGERPSDVVNMVVHLHSDAQALFHCLEVESTRDDAYEQALEGMIKKGHKLKLVDYGDFWGPIKYPWHIFAVMEHFLGRSKGGMAKTAKVSERATIEGDVIIDEGVTVLENAVIRGPCYIGKNSVIGNNVLIRDRSHIGENCVVGFSTEIKHSYIGDGCWFHRNYIGDSIIAERCSFGAGTITANLRFDEREVKIKSGDETIDTGLEKLGVIMGADSKTGINVSIMPGARIGPNSIVGSHVMLTYDLEPNRIILVDAPDKVIERRVGSD